MGETTISVIVVDDTNHVREMVASMLRVDGFDVVAELAESTAVVEAVLTHTPTVVVMDYKLASGDGLETTRRIRAARPDQTVILYTAFVDDELLAAARAVGAALCLAKAEGLGVLSQEIRRLAGAG